ncbi:MAG: Trk system potassium transporter TrkA [Clostridiales Family XIII bacterium]|jgi:trk system potassium uptake protein TrkA|nr:Trk system potassium transporter TrkA [Clostridiales Family XIII bacterium]
MKIAIAGAGKLGVKIAEMLTGGDHSVTVIDKSEEIINRYIAPLDVMSVVGNAKEITLLNEIGIAGYDFLIATTDRDEKNIVISSIAKKLGVPAVVARIRDPEHMDQIEFLMELFGIDSVVNPDLSVAEEINKYLVEKYTLSNGVFYAGTATMLEFVVSKIPKLIGMTTEEAERELENVRVAAISKNGKIHIPGSGEDITVDEDDYLYIVGARDHIEKFAKKVVERGKYTDIQRVMIAGGGKSGFYLAKLLEKFGASVKIIDSDKARCQYLSTHLSDALVLHGDATDANFLHEENFEDMDAFISTTGFDEENLLLALMAKQAGIEDVIAKISRDSFGDMIESVGIDMALNPVDIEASHIHRLIQGNKIITSQILQGQAEMIQIVVDDRMVLNDKTVEQLRLPEGIQIAAIQRGLEVIIPDPETVITAGDRVIILSQFSDAFDLEKLLKTKKGFFG